MSIATTLKDRKYRPDRALELARDRRIKRALLKDIYGLMELTGNAAALKDLERVFGEYLEVRL